MTWSTSCDSVLALASTAATLNVTGTALAATGMEQDRPAETAYFAPGTDSVELEATDATEAKTMSPVALEGRHSSRIFRQMYGND